jgi:hypothetical protein
MHARPNTRRHSTHHCGPRASVGWSTENSSEHTTPHPSAVMHCKILSIPSTTRQFQATANGTSISSDHFNKTDWREGHCLRGMYARPSFRELSFV